VVQPAQNVGRTAARREADDDVGGVQSLDRAQGLELLEREVLGEPAGDGLAVDRLGGLSSGELGVLGATTPAEWDGSEIDPVTYALLLEEIAVGDGSDTVRVASPAVEITLAVVCAV